MVLDPVPTFRDAERNPAQQEVLDRLGSLPDERVQYEPGLRDDLLAELEDGLAPVVHAWPSDQVLYLSKYPLAQVHACEARFVALHGAPFAWTVPSARGAVAHKAVELSIHWVGEPNPLDLVDEALARLSHGPSTLAQFLVTCSEVDRSELRAAANDAVSKFLECFPPLKPSWRPVTESAVRVELLGRRVVLQGRVDLTLGHARGSTARKVLIDLKTGGFSPTHVEDLRFYALLETIRIGTPPHRVATYYLDSGRPHPEPVTADTLRSALRRTVDGAHRMTALLHHDHAPVRRASPTCRWCPLLDTCPDGRSLLEDDDVWTAPEDPLPATSSS